MAHTNRKIGFVLAASNHGPLILDRFDFHQKEGGGFYGVGGQILANGAFDPAEVELLLSLLRSRRRHFGDGVFLLDCGANIGVHTVEAAMAMTGWGSVLAIEAQERIYYALAGNIALNNCFNARAMHAAVAGEDGTIRVPLPDYLRAGSFGSLELRQRPENEFIGQPIDYSPAGTQEIRCLRLDSLSLPRLDVLKIDIEGMEEEAIAGAQETIARGKPVMLVEYIKSNRQHLIDTFGALGYAVFQGGINLVAIHSADPTLEDFRATLGKPECTGDQPRHSSRPNLGRFDRAIDRLEQVQVTDPVPQSALNISEGTAPDGAAPETPPEPVPVPTEVIAGSVAASGSGPIKPAYPASSAEPTQHGPEGIRFDFNDGCRVVVPEGAAAWRVRLKDLDTDNTIYETSANFSAGRVSSTKRYFVRFRVEIWRGDEQLLAHDYDARDREVAVLFPVGTLGDTIGWFPYAVKFQERHKCRLTCAMAAPLIPLFADAYPAITFVTHEEFEPGRYYATYRLGLFFDDKDCVFQPCDFRLVGLHRTAGYILGADPTEAPPRLVIPDGDKRPIAEPYVCIAVQSSTQAKYWNNPFGWHETVAVLKEAGYRVICIDQRAVHGTGLVWNHIPHGAEDETGDRPLGERARWLRHAELFIGLSSGLAWLAWAAGTPVVLISGFTHPTNEFHTPFRVINYHACNSCWNDPRLRFDHHDFLWCPRHANTPRQFECTRLITAGQVTAVLQRIPGFGESVKVTKRAVRAA